MPSVAEFLVERLENLGVGHVFGVVRDKSNPFVDGVNCSSKINFVSSVDENGAGFCADTYARVRGVGCVSANYNAGALKLCNAIAGAYSERSPVMVVSISTPAKNRNDDFLLHHVVRSFDNQQKIFKNITCNSTILSDATKAGFAIDKAIEDMVANKQPVYLEIPSDVACSPIRYDVYREGTPSSKGSDRESLADAVSETSEWITASSKPVILVGVQVVRYGLSDKLVRFAEKYNIPMITTLLGKSSIDENHPLFAGVYCGSKSSDPCVLSAMDDSDCLLVFGECLADMTMGLESPRFAKRQAVFCSTDGLYVKKHLYNDVSFLDFCNSLFSLSFEPKSSQVFCPQGEFEADMAFLYRKIASMVSSDRNLAVVSDSGDYLAMSSRIRVRQNRFFSPAFQYSSGFAIPGSIGVQLACPDVRPIVILGQNSFKVSMLEIPTMVSLKLNPIIVVLGDTGFDLGIFRDFYGSGHGWKVSCEEDLEKAMVASMKSKEISLISLNLKRENS